MAEILETNQMLSNLFEPKRQFRWILAAGGIDAFTLKTAARPQMTFEDVTIDYMNVKRYLAGKPTWNPIAVTLYDPIAPSAAQKVMEWVRLSFESVTGRMGYFQFYAKDLNLKMLDPVGAVVEDWLIQQAWIQEFNFGELDYAISDPVSISLTLRFNQAILSF